MILADNLNLVKKISLTVWCALMLAILPGCSASEEPEINAITGLSMGTSYTVKWVSPDNSDYDHVANGVAAELSRVESSMSTYMDVSDLSGFNGAAVNEWHKVPAEMASLVAQSLDLSEQTNGCLLYTSDAADE